MSTKVKKVKMDKKRGVYVFALFVKKDRSQHASGEAQAINEGIKLT